MQQGLAMQMLYNHKTQPVVPSAPIAILPHLLSGIDETTVT